MSTRDSSMWSSTFSGSGSSINVVRPPFLLIDKSGKINVSPSWLTNTWKFEKTSYFIKMLHALVIEIYKRINQNTIFENKNPKHDKKTMILTLEILKLFKKRANQNNTKFVVVVLTAGNASTWKWLFNKIKENKIDSIDCSVESNVEKKYINNPGGHPNEKYNIHYSNCIHNYIVKNM